LAARGCHWSSTMRAGWLLTTFLCPRHETQLDRACPACDRRQLTLAWNHPHLILRCLRCGWRPLTPPKREPASSYPLGSLHLLYRLQCDISAALRDRTPSNLWCGPVSAGQFLRVVDDLYWLLRTPGLSAICGHKFIHRRPQPSSNSLDQLYQKVILLVKCRIDIH
jgi:hypothetical protein